MSRGLGTLQRRLITAVAWLEVKCRDLDRLAFSGTEITYAIFYFETGKALTRDNERTWNREHLNRNYARGSAGWADSRGIYRGLRALTERGLLRIEHGDSPAPRYALTPAGVDLFYRMADAEDKRQSQVGTDTYQVPTHNCQWQVVTDT